MSEEKKGYYVTRRYSRLLELRQERFRDTPGHPHDVCAVARTVEEMREMIKLFTAPIVDWSEVELEAL